METIATIKKIKEIALRNQKRHKSQKTHFVTEEKIAVGECFRQGDLYIFRVSENHQTGPEIERKQIADGVSVGARHILNGPVRVYAGTTPPKGYNGAHARVGIGYAFDAFPTSVLTHPEHDNYVFQFPSRWQVCHQIDLRTLSRAAD